MKRYKNVSPGYLLVGLLLMGSLLSAEVSKKDIVNTSKLIKIADKQRMLSQRIAKNYLYIGKKVAVDKATIQFKESLSAFNKDQKFLDANLNDPEIKNLILFINMSENELKEIVKKPFNLYNAQLVLDLSETMFEGSQYIIDSIKSGKKDRGDSTVATAERQRMLAQRIAKYYIAYQSGIKDKNTIDQIKAAVKLFDDGNKALLSDPTNSPEITSKLKEIDRLWSIVYKFYLNIEKGGLPFIVYISTDDITSKMDKIIKLYTK